MGSSLARSPRVRTRRLQPACFANVCSMWSRNPTPVHTQICWEGEFWLAWCSVFWSGTGDGNLLLLGRRSSGPPSRDSDTWDLCFFCCALHKDFACFKSRTHFHSRNSEKLDCESQVVALPTMLMKCFSSQTRLLHRVRILARTLPCIVTGFSPANLSYLGWNCCPMTFTPFPA